MILNPRLNESSVYSDPGVYSYCLPVQGRMAGTSISVAEFDSVIRGQHVYKSVWIPLTDKMHKHIMWQDNECDKYVVNDRL